MLFLHPLLLLLLFLRNFFQAQKSSDLYYSRTRDEFFYRDDFLTTWNPRKLLRRRISKQSFTSLNPTKKFVKPLP
jgi:hypothetical protein